MAHTDSVSTGSGVLPDGYGDDRLMTLPLDGAVPEMRLGYIQLQGVPLPATAQQFVDIPQADLGGSCVRRSEGGLDVAVSTGPPHRGRRGSSAPAGAGMRIPRPVTSVTGSE